MKTLAEYKSRLRVFKGGKIPLMVSAMLVGSVLNAADCVSGQVYDANATCTLPAGITEVTIKAWGGGGAGNYGFASSGARGGGGGGGGSYCGGTFAVSENAELNITVGEAGNTTSLSGGASGVNIIGSNNLAGVVANGGSGGIDGYTSGAGGAGGTTASCTNVDALSFTGGSGANGVYGSGQSGGGGGGSATLDADGGNASGTTGGTGQGSGGNGSTMSIAATLGVAPGGGGGGAAATSQSPYKDPTNGAKGRVIISFPTMFSSEVNANSKTFDINETDTNETSEYNGDLQGTLRGDDGQGKDGCSILLGTHRYTTQSFVASSTETHTILTTALATLDDGTGGFGDDNFMLIYEGSFDENNLSKGLVGCNDDIDYDNDNYLAGFNANLQNAKYYTVVFTAFQSTQYDADTNGMTPTLGTTGKGTFSVNPSVTLAYPVAGTVSGLTSGTLVLRNNNADSETIAVDGAFVFDTPLNNGSDYNVTVFTQPNSLECSVVNGVGSSSTLVDNVTITCSDVNKAPTFESSLGGSVTYLESSDPVTLDSLVTLTDGDLIESNYNGVSVSLSRQGGVNINDIFGATGNLTLENGDVNISTTKIGTFTNLNGSLSITFNSDANQSVVNEALSSITYENNATILPTSVVIVWSTNDNNGGSQGSGGALVSTGITTVNIQKIPKVSGSNAAAIEDGSYTFTMADFGTYSPIGSESGFNRIKIVSLPTNGVLKNKDEDEQIIQVGQEIYSGAIDGEYFTFTPNADAFGEGAGSFQFQIASLDDSLNVIYNSTIYTMELNVSAVNDAPTFKISEGIDYISLSNIRTYNSEDNTMLVQADGKILVAGYYQDSNSDTDTYKQFQVMRVNSDGTLDTSFGADANGIVKINVDDRADYVTAIALDSTGNIYLGGSTQSNTTERNMGVVKLTSGGILDTSFGGGTGKVIIDFENSSYDYLYGMTLDAQGRVLVAGSSSDDNTYQRIAVARLTTTGVLDISFNTTGKKEITTTTAWNYGRAIAMQGDKILVGGSNDDDIPVLYRLNSDGSIDNTFSYAGVDKQIYALKYDTPTGIIVGGRDYDTGNAYVEILNATTGSSSSITDLGIRRYVTDMVIHDGTTYYAVYDSSDEISTVVAKGAINFTKTFFIGEQEESYSSSIELASDGNLLVGGIAFDADWNSIYTITKLDSTTGEILTIGGESSLGQSVNHNRATPVVLDSDVTIKDAELDVTSYSGVTISLARDGEANSEDIFDFTSSITVSGNTLATDTLNLGTFQNSNGNLTITFDDINSSMVNFTMRNITYKNIGSGDENVAIAWTFSDGNADTDGTQGSGGAKIASGFTDVNVSGTYTPPTTNSVTLTVPYKNTATEVVLQSPTGTNISGATNTTASNLTKGLKLPLGSFSFDVNGLTAGQSVTMSMIVDKSIGSYTYYKQTNEGRWTNITKAVTFLSGVDAGKVRIDFELTDGGIFDRDETANGTIVDPGGIATNVLTPYVLEGTTLVGDASYVEDPTLFSGTVSYSISGGGDADKFSIDAATGELTFITAPTFATPTDIGDVAGNNTYVVEISVTGSTSGGESRAITVTVLNAAGANTLTPNLTALDVFTVIFKGHDGTVLKTQSLNAGQDATAPTPPARSGYTFSGWSSGFTNISADLNVTAEYSQESSGEANTEPEPVVPTPEPEPEPEPEVPTPDEPTEPTEPEPVVPTPDEPTEPEPEVPTPEQIITHELNGVTASSEIVGSITTQDSQTGDITTTATSKNADDKNVTIAVVAKGDSTQPIRASHTLTVNDIVTKAESQLPNTATLIKADGSVETTATLDSNGAEIKVVATPDGGAIHSVKLGEEESNVSCEIPGAQTLITEDGSIRTSVAYTEDGCEIKASVMTDKEGQTHSSFIKTCGGIVQEQETTDATTPFELGSTVRIYMDADGKLKLEIVANVTKPLKF